MSFRRKLLWVDCTAAVVAGAAVILLHGWLSSLYQLPREFLLFIGVANIVYASYSFSLAVRKKRPIILISFLVVANLMWAGMSLWWVVVFAGTASLFGFAHLLVEGLFVGGLALLEWRWRELIRRR